MTGNAESVRVRSREQTGGPGKGSKDPRHAPGQKDAAAGLRRTPATGLRSCPQSAKQVERSVGVRLRAIRSAGFQPAIEMMQAGCLRYSRNRPQAGSYNCMGQPRLRRNQRLARLRPEATETRRRWHDEQWPLNRTVQARLRPPGLRRGSPGKPRLVEPRGVEPLTPTMPLWCSTN